MKPIDLERVRALISLTHQLQKVERAIFIRATNRMENDVEHQYQLALVAWYLNQSLELELDTHKLIQYSLVHDFVEVYAGDVVFFDQNKDEASKHMREKEAAQQLKKEFPEFTELHTMIDAYEKREDVESQFIYALDKLVPIWNNQLNGGETWSKYGVTLNELIQKKTPKMQGNPITKAWFEQIIEELRKDEKQLFASPAKEINP